jgi:O-antigen/teichoic acid export membrane protein
LITQLFVRLKSVTIRKYFYNTSWLFLGKVLRIIVELFVGVWVARHLGPKEFGLLSFAQSFVGIFAVIATLGLDSILVREFVKHEDKQDILIGTALCLQLFGTFLVFFILTIAVYFTSHDNFTNTLIFIIASAIIFQSLNVVDCYFQSIVMSKYVVYANLIALLISATVKVTLILNEAPLIDFAFVVLLDSFVLSCGLIYFYLYNKLSIKSWTFSKKLAFELLKDSWPLIFTALTVSLLLKIDQVMLKTMTNDTVVGYYAVSSKLMEMWFFIPLIIANSLFPALLQAKKVDEELYYTRLQNLFYLMFMLSFSIALATSIFGERIVFLLYGEQFLYASNILVIHIWTSIFVFLGTVLGRWFIAENYAKHLFITTIIGLVLNILLNLLLIPEYGAIGAAVATLISRGIGVPYLWFINKKIVTMYLMSAFFWRIKF